MKTSRKMIPCIVAAISIIFALAATNSFAFEISIDMTPNTLNIQSQGVIVTVHTDIAYSAVVGTSVFLNGVAINYRNRHHFPREKITEIGQSAFGGSIW